MGDTTVVEIPQRPDNFTDDVLVDKFVRLRGQGD